MNSKKFSNSSLYFMIYFYSATTQVKKHFIFFLVPQIRNRKNISNNLKDTTFKSLIYSCIHEIFISRISWWMIEECEACHILSLKQKTFSMLFLSLSVCSNKSSTFHYFDIFFMLIWSRNDEHLGMLDTLKWSEGIERSFWLW